MKADEKRHGRGSKTQDFIRGKGSGLFILLHGVPGVGKTATAEAIALTKTQAMEIWQMNLDRLRKIDAEHQSAAGRKRMVIDDDEILRFTPRGSAQWNGRQIRNAFQVVRALAYADAAAEAESIRKHDPAAEVPPPRLGAEQFRIFDALTHHFEEYNKEVHGGQTEAEVARERELRADEVGPPNWSGDGRSSLRPPGLRAGVQGYQGRVPSPSRAGFEREYGGLGNLGPRNRTPRVVVGEEDWPMPTSPASTPYYANKSVRGWEYVRGLGGDEAGLYEPEYGDSKNEYGKRGRW